VLTYLQKKGVLLAQCENTVRERKINKDELWPFISYVPSGNGEIIIRQYQGWATVHP
ncbi:MAG: DsrE family protein, partial [Bacteroidota bacterium]|nr:DsrE family protein [Bacteroidota bacterium]